MKTALKYYVGINVKSDRRQVFGAHKQPTTASHGKHFSAVIGPFRNLRAALYVRDRGFNNPQIRCPADAERLCKVRPGPAYQRPKVSRRKGRARHSVRAAGKVAARGVQRTARPTRRKKNPARRNKLSPAQLRAGFGGKRRRNPVTTRKVVSVTTIRTGKTNTKTKCGSKKGKVRKAKRRSRQVKRK